MPILEADIVTMDTVCKADPEWRACLSSARHHRHGHGRTAPITLRAMPEADEHGAPRRMILVLAFVQAKENDMVWAHPVDGLDAYVDLVTKEVFEVIDEFRAPVPAESGDYDDPDVRGPRLRTTLKPIQIPRSRTARASPSPGTC